MEFRSFPGEPTRLRNPLCAKGVIVLDTEHHLTFHPTDIKINKYCVKHGKHALSEHYQKVSSARKECV